MQKVKHNFLLANKEISSGNVYLNTQTVNCMQYSEQIYCNSMIQLEIHTWSTSKAQQFALIEKKVLNEEERKHERKANRII